jgi:DNA-binding CsgD family transcriptional regulator
MDGALRAGAGPDVALTRALWAGALMSLVHSRSAAVLAALDPAHSATNAGTEADEADEGVGHGQAYRDADAELPVPAPPRVPPGPLVQGRTPTACFVVLTRVELACTLVCRGRAAEAVPLCAEAVALCEAHGEQWARSWALRTLALAHWAMGEYAPAAEQARACLRLPYTGRQRQSLARTLDLLGAAEALAGEAERAGVLRGAVDRIWHDIGGNPMEYRRPGRLRAPERHARLALGDHAYERAHRRGAALTPDEAVAYALRETSGEAAGETPESTPNPPEPTPAPAPVPAPVLEEVALTPREAQVAALVAEGRTNRQIADTLVIAQRTAEGHVERILAKLGFHSRSQVAAWFSAGARTQAGHSPPGTHASPDDER